MLKSTTTRVGWVQLGKATNEETDIRDDLLVRRLSKLIIPKLESD